MRKTILLARPHPFIVSEMKPLLEQAGFATRKLESLADLPTAIRGVSGVVVSLAISSPIGASAAEVLAEVRKLQPGVPVLFAAMLDLQEASSNLERLAKASGVVATVLGATAGSESHSGLGRSGTFVYLSKDDLSSPERRPLATQIIERHFR